MQETLSVRSNSVDLLHGDGGILVAFPLLVFSTQGSMYEFHTCDVETHPKLSSVEL